MTRGSKVTTGEPMTLKMLLFLRARGRRHGGHLKSTEEDMSGTFEGFWQVLVPDPAEGVRPEAGITLADRAIGCWLYLGGYYWEFWAHKGREPVTHWPYSVKEAATMFRSHRATMGRYREHPDADGFRIVHTPEIAVDPGHMHPFEHRVRVTGASAAVEASKPVAGRETAASWRQLSGPGTSPLAGVWESAGDERYVYAVTAAHYAIMRTSVPSTDGDPTDDIEAARLFRERSLNAGAHLLASRTFDHWPMFGSTAGYEVAKHPTFYLRDLAADSFTMVFDPADTEASTWRRLA
jgi:hypothetical protein